MDDIKFQGLLPDSGMNNNNNGHATTTTAAKRTKTKTASIMPSAPKFKKAPDAPKRFKSAFIIFSAEKHREIKEEFAKEGRAEKTTDIAKLVSEAWREMEPEEKEAWEQKARKDKARYEVEKAMYKGPWKIPANKRTPKDPTAPKRPMSAFLAFSNKRRAALKREHPEATNADLSKMLSKTWKEAPDELRQRYMDEEAELRATYKVEMAKWRKNVAEEKKAERDEREAMAMQAAEARASDPNAMIPGLPNSQGSEQNQQGKHQQPQAIASGMMNGGMGLQQNQDMSSGQAGNLGAAQMYGNAFGMAAGANPQFGNFMAGAQGGSDGSNNAQQYAANLMTAGNPFGAQAFMGSNAQQQMLLNQLLGQQLKSSMGQSNPFNQGVNVGMGMNLNTGGFGMGQGMNPMAAQQAMLEAQANLNQGGSFPGTGGFAMSGNNMFGGNAMGNESGKSDQDQQNFMGNIATL